jgi:hypothetical protein
LLRKPSSSSGKLKGVGARIVSGNLPPRDAGQHVLDRADAAFRPSLGPNNTTFRMVDLLLFAFEGKAALLNPVGD